VNSHGCLRLQNGKPILRTPDYRSRSELVDWYNTGTIYVVASSSEGTPNPALEAAACGCVVVSTPVGNMPELIEPGVNGELVPQDVDALEAAIWSCQERYEEMAQAMQDRITGWDWRGRAASYYALFDRLIGRPALAITPQPDPAAAAHSQ
jgi:glycosyltransferase involved in cell wall biosynthesis